MLALKSVGEVISKLVNAVVTKFEKKILKRPEPKHIETKSAVILFSLMIVSLFTGGTLQIFQNLSLREGVYFWFITCTTVGFGDYVPQKMTKRIRQLSSTSTETFEVEETISIEMFFMIECVIGLCVVSSVLNSIMAAIEERNWRPRCRGCIPRKAHDHAGIEQNNTLEQRESDEAHSKMENVAYQKENITTLSINDIK